MQEQKRRGGSSAARGKRSLVRKSTVVKQAIHTRPFISFVCREIDFVMSKSLYLFDKTMF
ncbi:hypothetical protein [Priestia megaterium]|uniref:hypothetical protein n=1 Tax=Priestia megaterium TaxID=1404 RepID=UPI001F5FD369|nr:hypothetical protein [Priestia megaterium]